ncbi:hypothetical protein HaLaN_26347, partial [Haematococcus lacustris]
MAHVGNMRAQLYHVHQEWDAERTAVRRVARPAAYQLQADEVERRRSQQDEASVATISSMRQVLSLARREQEELAAIAPNSQLASAVAARRPWSAP